jgi:hypothetical protein
VEKLNENDPIGPSSPDINQQSNYRKIWTHIVSRPRHRRYFPRGDGKYEAHQITEEMGRIAENGQAPRNHSACDLGHEEDEAKDRCQLEPALNIVSLRLIVSLLLGGKRCSGFIFLFHPNAELTFS